ncbi:hypothetical protein PVOR_27540 [Paenibacillus vortex V453]|jgi:hypothetical protein|uniref:Pyruvate kinase n=3 Tax=Paenibacillus TaxID=44249 RepID=A0A163FND2_9BACL|nr:MULTISPECIES: hypothetical protein [Paenibacillus]ANA79084.1 pyruvate kinase [Paenibacillus glucanolyticus]AVV56985.1 pyruvate kinase [Paenibacillus glucanolyticus]EFU39052.1 hypothetical protein PVOR_27540 [Paenibacillus vortex V453]ETT39230.1 hypothetical protein C169_10343 [Paenibacillus sp. FSL R5-808]KZS44488.1 pyruvate kinase [Paenibacillus glucanolyticus]
MQIDIQKLYDKYMTLDIPNPFNLEQIDQILKDKYFAVETDLENFSGLRFDPYENFDEAVKAYSFRDKRGIKELFKLNSEEYDESLVPNGINLTVNSKDNMYISGGTEIGGSNLLSIETAIFFGIDKEEMTLGNERFEDYLVALYLAGYIQFENDTILEDVYKRYRDSYLLEYYGPSSGRGGEKLY